MEMHPYWKNQSIIAVHEESSYTLCSWKCISKGIKLLGIDRMQCVIDS
jgi:hypothetical protein